MPLATQTRTSADLDRQQDLSFDPFDLMPADFPAHPRVMLSAEQLERAKQRLTTCDWARTSFDLLIEAADEPFDLPAKLPTPTDPEVNQKALGQARCNALAHLLTGDGARLDRALAAFDLLARDYPDLPASNGARVTNSSLSETKVTLSLGKVYDLLAAAGLDDDRDKRYRAMLLSTRAVSDTQPHMNCGAAILKAPT